MTTRRTFTTSLIAAAALATAAGTALAQSAPVTLLNVSYDPTRELYVEDRPRWWSCRAAPTA